MGNTEFVRHAATRIRDRDHDRVAALADLLGVSASVVTRMAILAGLTVLEDEKALGRALRGGGDGGNAA